LRSVSEEGNVRRGKLKLGMTYRRGMEEEEEEVQRWWW